MAEGIFLYEMGSAQLTQADLTNSKRWDEVGDSVFSQPTKHTLNLLRRSYVLIDLPDRIDDDTYILFLIRVAYTPSV
jgi:hypothetical protein